MLKGLSCEFLYVGTEVRKNACAWALPWGHTCSLRTSWSAIFFLLGGRTCLDVWPCIRGCPANAVHQSLYEILWRGSDLLVFQLCRTLTVKKNKFGLWKGCWFVSIFAACQVYNCEPDSIPMWAKAISAGQTDKSKAMRFQPESGIQDSIQAVNLAWQRNLVQTASLCF